MQFVLAILLSVPQAAKETGLSHWTFRKWLAQKPPKLPFIKLGRRVMISSADLAEFIKKNRVE